jgi:hypothetical protein
MHRLEAVAEQNRRRVRRRASVPDAAMGASAGQRRREAPAGVERRSLPSHGAFHEAFLQLLHREQLSRRHTAVLAHVLASGLVGCPQAAVRLCLAVLYGFQAGDRADIMSAPPLPPRGRRVRSSSLADLRVVPSAARCVFARCSARGSELCGKHQGLLSDPLELPPSPMDDTGVPRTPMRGGGLTARNRRQMREEVRALARGAHARVRGPRFAAGCGRGGCRRCR